MTRFKELVAKLSELFELDKADLDFGIHRIIKTKHDQITKYLNERLPERVKSVLGELAQVEVGDSLADLKQQVIDGLGAAAFNEDGALDPLYANTPLGKRYAIAEENAKYATKSEQTEAEVYSHLYEFFSRYYEEGDFISRQRRTAGRETYSVPYDGEEVVLHWANKDQYYVKSTEDLKDYTFAVPVNPSGDTARVQFKLTRMDAVQNNNKASRIFVLDEEAEIQATGDTLVIPFHFAEGKKRTKPQEAEWEQAVLDALPEEWQQRLAARDTTYTGDGERSILQKHLRNYTKRNTSDYFIHKDLGGFLRRELDFYIKNEVMYLDDVDSRPADYLEKELRKIKAIRAVAHDLIDFLAQFEDFQKRLWLKKKFVIETNWCITLDRVPEELYPEIAANDAQREEWEKLGFGIWNLESGNWRNQENKEDTDSATSQTPELFPAEIPNPKSQIPNLILDTAFFPPEFKSRLLASTDDIDDKTDGVLIHSENFQALSLLSARYKEVIQGAYIDPPYNTGDDGFCYKDSYMSSSWLTAIADRLKAGMDMLRGDATMLVSIGDEEQEYLATLCRALFGKKNFYATLIWEKKKKGSFLSGNIARMKDYVLCLCRDDALFQGLIGEIVEAEETYPCVNASNPREIRRISPGIQSKYREENYHLAKGEVISAGNMNFVLHSDLVIEDGTLAKELVIEGNWRYSQESMNQYAAVGDLYITQDLYLRRIVREPRKKRLKDILPRIGTGGEGDFRSYDIQNLSRYGWGSNEDANDELHQLLGTQYAVSYPKPSKLITLLLASTRISKGWWIDYFAGSGTTGHAVINLNRQDGGKRKYILVEMGEYFDTVLKPRIQKVIFSEKWKDGKPVPASSSSNPKPQIPNSKFNGISHCFKYLRLESYEDALNNLTLDDRSADLLGLPEDVRDDYLLRYSLDIETRASLLDLERFENPFDYKLKVYNRETGEAKPHPVDLPETFNYLLGLRVRTMQMRDGFLVIEGENPAAETVLVIWRNVHEKDNAALETFVTGTLRINPADTEYAAIYINGDTTLDDPHKKILLTEQAFGELMFADNLGFGI